VPFREGTDSNLFAIYSRHVAFWTRPSRVAVAPCWRHVGTLALVAPRGRQRRSP
jgi:hypothetical protein